MDKQVAIVLGSTGLIGGNVVEQLLNNDGFPNIRLLVRKPLDIINSKIEMLLTDFNKIDDFAAKTGKGDCLFCCVGTTRQAVKGNKEAYRKVDYDIVVNAARICVAAGCKQIILVSSVGANAGSSNFYLKLKGEIERDISVLPFEGIHIFRPSILLGRRKEFRLTEKIGQEFMHVFSFLFIGALSKYKGIYAKDVAKAMVAVAGLQLKGIHVYEHEQMAKVLSGANIAEM